MGLGEKIKEARKKAGLTQEELASKVNVSSMSIRRYETGERSPKTETLNKIADVCNVSSDWLLGKIEVTQSENKAVFDSLRLSEKSIANIQNFLSVSETNIGGNQKEARAFVLNYALENEFFFNMLEQAYYANIFPAAANISNEYLNVNKSDASSGDFAFSVGRNFFFMFDESEESETKAMPFANRAALASDFVHANSVSEFESFARKFVEHIRALLDSNCGKYPDFLKELDPFSEKREPTKTDD